MLADPGINPHTSFSTITWHVTKQKVSDLVQAIYWRLPGGACITVLWPRNSEPNEAWRPYLEEHVGAQGIHWQWRLSQKFTLGTNERSGIDLKFLRKRTQLCLR